jgi:hypothetical protein
MLKNICKAACVSASVVAALTGLSACVVAPERHPHMRVMHDEDRDGVPNRYDRDRDGDGVPNRYDRRPDNPYRY